MRLSDTATHACFEKSVVAKDLLQLCAGEFLGSGRDREVFVFKPDPTKVIKFETGCGNFQNVIEWGTWDRIKDVKHVARWFCPLISISPCGTILIQERAGRLRESEFPKQVPAYMTDLKMQNWGLYKGKPVCIDFGIHLLMEEGMSKRMKRAAWWDYE